MTASPSPATNNESSDIQLDVNPLTVEDAAAHVIDKAASMNASDLFLLSHEDYVAIHVRHLGRVRKLGIVSSDKGRRLIQHFKVIAEMDVAEHRRPLDGRFMHESEDPAIGTVDLRVNAIPTMYGEDLALRLLLRDAQRLQLGDLGLTSKQHGEFRSMLESPGGLVLCVGPTGAGKTTSLYAAIEHLNDGSRKINTIEDPIEYGIEGVRQTQIAPNIGVGFAEMLRGVLRQSSDVIMVGEVRDEATAQTTIRAANAGRLVLATVHANVATAAVETMLNFGVNPHFLAAGLRGVIAQRLIRTLDPDSRTEVDLSGYDELFEPVRPLLDTEPKLFAPDTTQPNEGYQSQTGVFEVFRVQADSRRLINDAADSATLRQKAIDEGMLDFRRSALLKVAQGTTSLEEVFRVIPFEFLRGQEQAGAQMLTDHDQQTPTES